MIRALWLADEKPPKQFTVLGETAAVIAIKNSTLHARLVPQSPETMTVRAVVEWAELVRRVATGYGANTVMVDKSLLLEPLLLTLRYTLRPYRVSLRIIE